MLGHEFVAFGGDGRRHSERRRQTRGGLTSKLVFLLMEGTVKYSRGRSTHSDAASFPVRSISLPGLYCVFTDADRSPAAAGSS